MQNLRNLLQKAFSMALVVFLVRNKPAAAWSLIKTTRRFSLTSFLRWVIFAAPRVHLFHLMIDSLCRRSFIK